MINQPLEILKKYWGYDAFRSMQSEIIESVLQGNDTLALLPTGGGKSICFQVPALCRPGLCLVVSPLIALMNDQIENLKSRGINAVGMYSGMHARELEMAFEKCADGRAKFVYVSPERLESQKFRKQLRSFNLSLIAVDEAHCISQWGYDFRPPYLKIADIRELFPSIPVLALTATAVPEVVVDIQRKLQFSKPKIFSKSFVRENLTYVVSFEEDKIRKILKVCASVKGCGIIYVRSRKLTTELAGILIKAGVSATSYHAGLEPEQRSRRQHDWTTGKSRIIVATNAFGMGIDKPDVRFVIHYDLPDTLEAYYQEAGRAGRDGLKSYAVILYNEHDIIKSRNQVENSWPDTQTVRNVYNALGNYLNLPVGSGKDVSFDFRFEQFNAAYKLKPVSSFSALRILERDGYVSLDDAWDKPSRVFIICSKDDLYQYQIHNSEADHILRVMLRSYSGLFTDFTIISENEIARRTGIDSPKVASILESMQKNGVLLYIPQKKLPQLTYSTERLNANEILLSAEFYHNRKKNAFLKLEQMILYLENNTKCRSSQLVDYFGEKNASDCGVCDVCLERRKKLLNQAMENDLEKTILKLLKIKPQTIDNLTDSIKGYKSPEIITVVRLLLDEAKVQTDGRLLLLPD